MPGRAVGNGDREMNHRVVVTGLGVVTPNANTVADSELALRKGRSGIRRISELDELGFTCSVSFGRGELKAKSTN